MTYSTLAEKNKEFFVRICSQKPRHNRSTWILRQLLDARPVMVSGARQRLAETTKVNTVLILPAGMDNPSVKFLPKGRYNGRHRKGRNPLPYLLPFR
jgi:hypothetical protein